MYAVIRAGGKQYKVATGDVLEIDRIKDGSDSVRFEPLLVVDDDGTARVGKDDLAGAIVTAEVVAETRGPKIDVYKFRNKSRYRRHTGHRQKYTSIRIADIAVPGASSKSRPQATGEERRGS